MTTIDSPPGNAVAIVLTRVSGSGKSEVGRAVAKGLGLKFLDADDFHSNKDKMHRGIALTDDDRLGWLKSAKPTPYYEALPVDKRSGRSVNDLSLKWETDIRLSRRFRSAQAFIVEPRAVEAADASLPGS